MPLSRPLKVAALVDLPRCAVSGGHVRGWEYRAKAVAKSDRPIDLTVFFSGNQPMEELSPHVRFRHLPPVFSTARLRAILPYIPDNTDLAPYHPALAKELAAFDVIHTTDGFFAFSRTAEKISKKHAIPLVTSFHTDTVSYSNVFTRKTINSLFHESWLSRFLNDTCKLPEKQEQKMLRRLRAHLNCCSEALYIRPEDLALVEETIGKQHAHAMGVVVDKERFSAAKADRQKIEALHTIPAGRFLIVFIGRLDVGKNIYTLIEAMEDMVKQGLPVHLFTAGIGPADKDLRARLGDHVTVAGFVEPDALADVLASADTLALCSEIEIRSQVILEALSSGLPVAVSAKSGIADLVPEAHPALSIVYGQGEGWSAALSTLVHNPARIAAMREAAKTYARDHIATWETVMRDDFLPVWQQAFDTKKS
ncbi:MAG: glycosyltransferase [Alphaproteobacteria bacterium]|nr:glycosyltransferase [Alphaproteobacteria bacterium]